MVTDWRPRRCCGRSRLLRLVTVNCTKFIFPPLRVKDLVALDHLTEKRRYVRKASEMN